MPQTAKSLQGQELVVPVKKDKSICNQRKWPTEMVSATTKLEYTAAVEDIALLGLSSELLVFFGQDVDA